MDQEASATASDKGRSAAVSNEISSRLRNVTAVVRRRYRSL
jgi:hypothetical protein